ncbi:MAG: AMP-binding protein, partial [bacterium]|nr:AMP-binding protein [bacterium]
MRKENLAEDIDLVANKNIIERDYWLRKLSGEPEKCNFPYDFVHREEKKSKNFDTVKFSFSEGDYVALQKLSSGSDYTLHIILSAAVAAVMARYTAKEDIIIGAPIYKQDIEGDFINTVIPLRCLMEAGMTFKDLLLQLRGTILEAATHQNYPIEALLFQLNMKVPEPSEDFPLFDTAVLLENVHDREYLGHIHCNTVFSFVRTDSAVKGVVTFNSSLFKKTTIEKITGHLLNWFQAAAANLDSPLVDIKMLSSEEKELLSTGFNAVDVSFPREKTIHRLIEEQVEKAPDRTAVQCRNVRMSYRQLNGASNRLGHILATETGIGIGDLVGILMERSEKMAVSILAAWKCGGAYIPLEVNDPVERIKTIIEDSGIKVLVGDDKALLDKMAECMEGAVNTVYLDSDNRIEIRAAGAGEVVVCETPSPDTEIANLNVEVAPREVAYVIYTSGSTGKPKGAVIEHVGMTNHILAKIADLDLREDCVIAQNASHCFDISIWQFFTALVTGGKTVIYDKDMILNPEAFIEAVESDAVSVLEVVPSYLAILLGLLDHEEQKERTLFRRLRILMATGETLKPALVRRWFARFPGLRMVNAYGPTEASDDITHYIMDKAPDCERIPIRSPL